MFDTLPDLAGSGESEIYSSAFLQQGGVEMPELPTPGGMEQVLCELGQAVGDMHVPGRGAGPPVQCWL